MNQFKRISRFSFCVTFYFLCLHFSIANAPVLSVPCTANDDCETAIVIAGVDSDQSYACLAGCNLDAAPDPSVAVCQMGDFPTVWYKVQADGDASVMNIEVKSDDFESPVISLFKSSGGCSSLEQVSLTNGNLSCVIGSHGVAMAIGTSITALETYYIAVSSLISIGGDFQICVSTISKGSYCVVGRNLQITARSNGGSLEGPFDPGEKISVCMNIDSYTAAGNGCQWFQGIVPVFGNGWDPTSYDTLGQPSNATVNSNLTGVASNGLYGASTWDWFDDVGYHHDNAKFKIGDFDQNGRIEMCNGAYEIDCPLQSGITGGCCGPCWDDPGDILPPGWFAYGINGTCPTVSPPIAVDWGDGNTCGGNMGPWRFCFDLITRSKPDCLEDSTRRDLTLGFYTFADGETGSWTGGESVCSYDQPVKVTFKTQCGRVRRDAVEKLHDVCSGDIFRYTIADDEVSTWEWNISPFEAAPMPVHSGPNGFVIESEVFAHGNKTQPVTGILIGYIAGSQDVVIKKFFFNVLPCNIYGEIPLYVDNDDPSSDPNIFPINPINENKVSVRSSEIKNLDDFTIYPIPSRDRITIRWSNIMKPSLLSFFDTNGILVESIPMGPELRNSMEANIAHLSAGVYIVLLQSEQKVKTAKLIKM